MPRPVDQPSAAREPTRVPRLAQGRPRGRFPSAEERALERNRIIDAIAAAGGSRKQAAAALGYGVRRLHRRIDALGIQPGDLVPAPPGVLPPPEPIPDRDPSDQALVEQAVRLVRTARSVGKAIGAREARVSLVKAGKARLTAEQRAALDALLASPPAREPAPTADGRLLDNACARLGLTLTALAGRLGVGVEHLSRVRHDRAKLGGGARAVVEAMLADPAEGGP